MEHVFCQDYDRSLIFHRSIEKARTLDVMRLVLEQLPDISIQMMEIATMSKG